MSQIHILDGQEDIILDYITAKNIIRDNHKKSLEDTLETYDFITFADKRFSEFLEKRNRIIIPDEDNILREFIIFEGQRYRDSEGHKVQVFANASYLELKKASIIYPNTFKGTASQHAGRALNDTGWQVGIVEVSGDVTVTISEHTNPYENLKRISKEFKAELRFRIEHDGSKVIGRYVDLLERVGDWQGREVTFGKDLDSIRRVEKQDVVTALLGLGPEKEDGTRLEVLVEDEEALQRWGRIDENGKLKHLIEVYEIQSERTEMTETQARQYTRTALDKRINTQVTYETTIVDLEEVAGHENKKIRFGDTIRIKDEKFNPPLYLEARVFETNRSIKSKAKKDIKLGDYIEYTEEEVNTLWEQLKKEIQDRLARLVIATVVSSGGDVFKNGVGATQLTAKTFVNGHEVDEDASRYEYQWIKFDKESNQVDDFIETGKTINVTANDIDEKATYRVLIAYDLDVVTTVDYTLTHLFDGQKGEDGKDGKSSYTHVRYSQNADGSGMNTNPTNAVYVGIAVTESPIAPTSNKDYDWSRIKGEDGVGTPGEDGKTSYVHIKYSDDGGKTFTSNNGEDPGDYIGTYTDFVQADSNDVNKYTWAKVKGEDGKDGKPGAQGIPGEPGKDGKTYFTWVKYANTPTSGMSDNPSGKDYIGLAYNKESPTMSTKYSDYTWSLFKGPQGVQGQPGADGEPTYTWIKYADDDKGNGMSDSPNNKKYIGLAFNKKTATESTNKADYSWSLMPQNLNNGGRNIINHSKGNTLDDWVPWSSTTLSIYTSTSFADGEEWIWSRKGSSNQVGVHTPPFNLKANKKYIISFTIRSLSNSGYQLNYLYLRSGQEALSTVKSLPQISMQDEEFEGNIAGDGLRVWFEFEHDEDIKDARILLAIRDRPDNAGFVLREIQIEQSDVLNPWKPSTEDVDESIQKAQTTADGKNTILRQNSEPSTAGRKVGDVWFKTNDDNKMHTFDGTKWNPATFGEQAITAESITALHIKSLNGLNVNDQFMVDNNGNVTFKGELQGAKGTFTGKVSGGSIEQIGTGGRMLVDNSGLQMFNKDNELRASMLISKAGMKGDDMEMVFWNTHGTAGGGTELVPGLVIGNYYTGGIIESTGLELRATELELRIDGSRVVNSGIANYGVYVNGGIWLNSHAGNGVQNGVQFGNDEHFISAYQGDWNFYGNRSKGNPFVVRSHANRSSFRDDFWIEPDGRFFSRALYGNTSSSASNARVSYVAGRGSTVGTIFRTTSALKYKKDVRDVKVDPYKLLKIKPRKWKDKGEIEELGGNADDAKWIYGLIADEVHAAGLSEYVEYIDGEIEGLHYDRIWTLLIPIVEKLVKDMEELKYGRSAV